MPFFRYREHPVTQGIPQVCDVSISMGYSEEQFCPSLKTFLWKKKIIIELLEDVGSN